jgi:hypothetical protein
VRAWLAASLLLLLLLAAGCSRTEHPTHTASRVGATSGSNAAGAGFNAIAPRLVPKQDWNHAIEQRSCVPQVLLT